AFMMEEYLMELYIIKYYIKKALEKNDTDSAALITQKYLGDINNISLNIAVTGESGVGKSTFVNAFRGIDNRDEGAAPTGVVETTMKPEPYPHPRHPNVTLWDLPGVGTTKFPADQYLKYVEFEKFDFFIIVSADRLSENDAKLAQEIKKIGRKFYFVRSKIDNNLSDAKRSQREYDEEKTLQEIRENCIQGLEKQGVASPQVFLVSSFHLHLYDFPALQDTMERELPSHKRDFLILVLPNICKSTIYKKKEVFRSRIKYYAILSAFVAAVPIPGLSIAADSSIVAKVLQDYLNGLGLDEKSLEKVSNATKRSLSDVRHSVYPTVLVAAEEGSRMLPVLKIPIAALLSFTSIYRVLTSTLESLSVDAENVLMEALDIK
uniref:IRG-type G domain-containing protein n=1 Tax=Gadus morhua TaxID=8049 RepID=A0A8C4ZNB9_GADMO